MFNETLCQLIQLVVVGINHFKVLLTLNLAKSFRVFLNVCNTVKSFSSGNESRLGAESIFSDFPCIGLHRFNDVFQSGRVV